MRSCSAAHFLLGLHSSSWHRKQEATLGGTQSIFVLSFFESKHLFLKGAYSPRETGLSALHGEAIFLCHKI